MRLTPNERSALCTFASRYGRGWKNHLRACWSASSYPSWAAESTLQGLRNRPDRYPTWLRTFRFRRFA